jgi:hypothetical protein
LKNEKEKDEMVIKGKITKDARVKLHRPNLSIHKKPEESKENMFPCIATTTTNAFFKKGLSVAKTIPYRPNTTANAVRTHHAEDEEEYLKSTFHPDVKWKVV